jgi:Flp pilus assembly protein TadD
VPALGRAPSPSAERRWLLDRARSEQRGYRLTAAERLYRQVLTHAPRDSEALTGLGELALLRGTVDLADAHFRDALGANADYIPARIAIADILWQSGRVDEARGVYRGIVEGYAPDDYPPYVVQRSSNVAMPPCEH